MLSLQERETISRLFIAGLSAAEISRRLGRSIGAIYKYKAFVTTNSQHPNKQAPKNTTITKQRSLHIETKPGEEAQVDWGTFGRITHHGKRIPLYGFFYILSYSRKIYGEFTIHQDQKTLQQCHINAFKALGIPKRILYDNMKTVVIRHITTPGSKEVIYNQNFLDFARYYGFTPVACHPYWPQSKGKVEATVKYIKSAFIPSLKPSKNAYTLESINSALAHWVKYTADQRTHRSTLEKPSQRYLNETKSLMNVSILPDYTTSIVETRRSTKDGMVAFKGNMYSIPMHYAGTNVSVREVTVHGQGIIRIYDKCMIIAEHIASNEKGLWVDNSPTPKPSNKKQKHRIKHYDIDVPTRDLSYYDHLLM